LNTRGQNTERCARCRLHPSLCICTLLPRIETRTRLCLVMHRFEDKKPTNTGRLAVECLTNSEVKMRGDAAQREVDYNFGEGTRPLVLFPHDDATALEGLPPDPRPITLIVPDGNWRQAAKVRARTPGLAHLPSVRLPPGPPTLYRLRAAPHEHGLATLEAVARAYGILEGEAVQRALEAVFLAMVERTLWFRGLLAASEVKCGIPDGAARQNARHGQPPL
jgi:DTW domain-containing protein